MVDATRWEDDSTFPIPWPQKAFTGLYPLGNVVNISFRVRVKDKQKDVIRE